MLKRIALLLALACAPATAFSQVFSSTALQNSPGNYARIVPFAPVTICQASDTAVPCTLRVTTYTDQTLSVQCSLNASSNGAPVSGALCNNPGIADANGNFTVNLQPGTYQVCTYSQNYQCVKFTAPAASVGLPDPGSNGIVKRTALNATAIAAAGDVTTLFTGCTGTNFLRSDGTCAAAGAVSSVFTRAGAVVAQSGDYTWDLIGAGSSLFAQSMGTGGSMKPLNLGQVAGSQAWLPAGLIAPATTGANSGGSIIAAHPWLIQYTFQTALGETLPSVLLSGSTTTLTGGTCVSSVCTLTITAPTFPTGVTGWTVYACDTSPTPCTAPQLRAACQNLAAGVNCTFTAPQSSNTSGVPTTNTAWVQPPNVQAFNGSAGEIPAWFFPKVDGNNYPWLGVDVASCDATNGPPLPCGTPVFTHRTYFNDTRGATQLFKNSGWSFNHTTNIGTVATNQDRAVGIYMQNPATDSTAHYSVTALQTEADFNDAATITGSPDGELAAGSFQVADFHTGVSSAIGTLGGHAVRAHYFIESGAGSFSSCGSQPCIAGVQSFVQDLTSSGGSSNAVAAFYGRAYNANGSHTSRQGFGFYIQSPGSTGRFGTANYGLYVEPWVVSSNVNDRSFMFDGTSSTATKGVIQPALWLGGGMVSGQCAICSNIFSNTGTTSLPVFGSFQLTGSISTAQLTNLGNPSCAVTGTTGTNYTYEVVAIDGNGNATTGGTCTASAAGTLNGSNFVTVQITVGIPKGAVRVDLYRTASAGIPATTGLIGSLGPVNTDVESSATNATLSLADTGLSASGSVPTANTTGGFQVAGDLTFITGKGQHVNTQAANNDFAGTCTASAATTCTVTFTRAYASAPICTATDATNITTLKVTPSTTSLIITTTGASSDVFDYICVGNPN